ncbi:MAG: chemotaxis protein CheA [Spirochaetales bacterium]|nr:chemotaxis protein CheA [Spirochaetales bacterium]
MSDYLDPNNEELLKDFYSEAQMQVEAMEQNILALEDDPADQDAIDEIFRAAHTLKGGSATVQMEELSSFTHQLEDLLDVIRSGRVRIDGEQVDVLLASIDVIKSMLEARQDGSTYDGDYSAIAANLEVLANGGSMMPTSVSPPPELPSTPSPTPSSLGLSAGELSSHALSEYEMLEMAEVAKEGESVYRIRVHFDESNPMNSVGGIQIFARMKDLGQILRTMPDFDALYEDVYHPVVDYFLSTSKSEEELIQGVSISDVTTEVLVSNLENLSTGAESLPPSVPSTPTEVAVEKPQIPEEDLHADVSAVNSQGDAALPKETEGSKSSSKAPSKRDGGGSILRVDSQRIDNLLNLVSESVINKATFNQISSQFSEIQNEFSSATVVFKEHLKNLSEAFPQWLDALQTGRPAKELKEEFLNEYGELSSQYDRFEADFKSTVASFKNTAANLGRNTSDLHEAILRIRMVPISQIFSRFPRLVRDLSKSLDKKIDLIIEGEDTELDKSVTEELLDPLMHCVRNSLDHGIETVDERRKAGKDGMGRLLLKASNEGNMIVIEIADDGAGIDVDKVRQKAIDRGIIHPSKVLTDIEAYNLIFEPGFSTAGEVTNISGRGVGLDVVRKQIEKLNGSVTVWSKLGEGTRFTIKLPLTLAIIQGLLVRVGTEVYAIPITSVVESHRIKPEDINVIDNYEVFNVREDVISLLRLNKLFRIDTKDDAEYNFIVIVGSGDKKMGLMVDSLIGEEDVVIKPLKDRYTNSPGIAGATILGDGTVSLIIDVSQLLELGVRTEQEARQNRIVQ